jgi:hypothetical protein
MSVFVDIEYVVEEEEEERRNIRTLGACEHLMNLARYEPGTRNSYHMDALELYSEKHWTR